MIRDAILWVQAKMAQGCHGGESDLTDFKEAANRPTNMGAYYDIVNPIKRQLLRIDSFGENFKWSGVITGSRGESLHAMAIAAGL